mgnify:FL=1
MTDKDKDDKSGKGIFGKYSNAAIMSSLLGLHKQQSSYGIGNILATTNNPSEIDPDLKERMGKKKFTLTDGSDDNTGFSYRGNAGPLGDSLSTKLWHDEGFRLGAQGRMPPTDLNDVMKKEAVDLKPKIRFPHKISGMEDTGFFDMSGSMQRAEYPQYDMFGNPTNNAAIKAEVERLGLGSNFVDLGLEKKSESLDFMNTYKELKKSIYQEPILKKQITNLKTNKKLIKPFIDSDGNVQHLDTAEFARILAEAGPKREPTFYLGPNPAYDQQQTEESGQKPYVGEALAQPITVRDEGKFARRNGYVEGLEGKFMPQHGLDFKKLIPEGFGVGSVEEVITNPQSFMEYISAVQLGAPMSGSRSNPRILAGRILGFAVAVAREAGVILGAEDVPLSNKHYNVWMGGYNGLERAALEQEKDNTVTSFSQQPKQLSREDLEDEAMYHAGLRVWASQHGGEHIPVNLLWNPIALEACKRTLEGGMPSPNYQMKDMAYYMTLSANMDPHMKMQFLSGGPVARAQQLVSQSSIANRAESDKLFYEIIGYECGLAMKMAGNSVVDQMNKR